MADALVVGILITGALMILFFLPIALGAEDYYDGKSIWEQWCAGMVIIAVMIVFFAGLLLVMLGMGYFALWFV